MRVRTLFLLAALAAPAVLSAQEEERIVRDLKFAGNRAIDDYTLSIAIATTNSSWAARYWWIRWTGLGEKRRFDEVEFRRDVVRLILLYRQSGHMNAVVDTVVRRTPRDVFITFRIHEGQPVRVTQLDIRGIDGIVNESKLRRALPLQVGDPFNRFLLQASADTIVARLRNNGYPYAEVLRNFDSEAGVLRAEVVLEALPGPRMLIGDVAIRGLDDVDAATVRRIMTVRPGELFRQEALYQTQRDLYSMGVFRAANVVLVDSLPPEGEGGGRDSTVGILVQVQEGPQHRIRFGVGYGSVECFRVQSGWSAHDFLGGARILDLSARLAKIGGRTPRQTDGLNQLCNPFVNKWTIDTVTYKWTIDTLNYTLGLALRQPAFLNRAHTASLGFFAERRSEFQVYTREAIGGNAEITLNARGTVAVTIAYGYSVGSTIAQPGIYCSLFRLCDAPSQAFLAKRRHFGAVTVTGVRDRVNNVLEPSDGSLATATLLHASRIVGSENPYEFNRGELGFSKYHPIGRRSVFAWRVRGGTILPQDITLSGQRVGYVPPDQRFYAGGPNSVRGYGRNELGPRVYVISRDTSSFDTTASGEKVFNGVTAAPTGGNSAVVLNAELRFPSPILAQRVRLGLFVDVGQVWERGEAIKSTRGLRVTPGVGLRFATPLGPVRVDVAYNGYPAERGPLLFQTDSIIRIRDDYPPAGAKRNRIVWQFAVGHAF